MNNLIPRRQNGRQRRAPHATSSSNESNGWCLTGAGNHLEWALQRAVGAYTDGVIDPQSLVSAKAVDSVDIVNRLALY